jgi:transposase
VSIKQRAYPEQGAQSEMLFTHCSHARFVYNLGVEQLKMCDKQARGRGVKISFAIQSRQLTEARTEFDWLREGSTVVQQGALRDLSTSFSRFCSGVSGFPKFHKRSNRQSFVVRDVVLERTNRKWGRVLVPKAGWLKFRITRAWHDIRSAKSARVVYHNNHWHVSFTTGAPERKPNGSGVVGIDRGVKLTVATSDGESFVIPSLREGEQKRFTALEAELTATTLGSRNRERVKAKLNTLRRKLTNRREDFVEKLTSDLASRYEIAGVENLNITGMVAKPKPKPDPETPGAFLPNGAAAKSGLARAIHASCWGKIDQRLSDKMEVVKVRAAYTSQRCSRCGHVSGENRESQEVFICKNCGHKDNADINAAENVKEAAGHVVFGLRSSRSDTNHLTA